MCLVLYNAISAALQKHGISSLRLWQIRVSAVHGCLPEPMAMAPDMICIYGMNPPIAGSINLTHSSDTNWNTVHPGSDFVTGRGYLYSVQAANPTKEFAGNLNNGPVSYGLTYSSASVSLKGFNLVGNPYPSSVDWYAASGWTRSNLVSSGGGYDMWIWNPAANNYGVYNSADADGVGTNPVTRYIAPMQGYFVQAASAGNLTMNNDVRVHDGAGTWFKNAGITPGMVSVVVKSESDQSFDEVNLLFGYAANQPGAKNYSAMWLQPQVFLCRPEMNIVQYDTLPTP